jgi:hypothetical protein
MIFPEPARSSIDMQPRPQIPLRKNTLSRVNLGAMICNPYAITGLAALPRTVCAAWGAAILT